MPRKSSLSSSLIPSGPARAKLPLLLTHLTYIPAGKAGVPVELGLRVCIVEDHYHFILHHQFMEKTTDDQLAVPLIKQTQARFSVLDAVSMDKGFHSPSNQAQLKDTLKTVVMPKKGRRSEADKAHESTIMARNIQRLGSVLREQAQ